MPMGAKLPLSAAALPKPCHHSTLKVFIDGIHSDYDRD